MTVDPARDAEARREFEAGRDAYDHGAFGDALARYERAYALSQRAELLFNIGRAADSDDRIERARDAYMAYLTALPDASNKEFVSARLERMRALLAERQAAAQRTNEAPPQEAIAAPIATVASVTPIEAAPLTAAAPARDDRRSARPFFRRAWFWGVVGAVVAGGVTATALSLRGGAPEPTKSDAYVTTKLVRVH